ncbi:hypothetical protein [Desulfosporosinus acidiphilus]|uniref:hypothetical protein n=1 Tax=Desulfosporosinus acidiphilus TaxID=885581 RepID=UPI0002E91928|nr:hypothetical protein [Desulfosporosinus acidiphilus]
MSHEGYRSRKAEDMLAGIIGTTANAEACEPMGLFNQQITKYLLASAEQHV